MSTTLAFLSRLRLLSKRCILKTVCFCASGGARGRELGTHEIQGCNLDLFLWLGPPSEEHHLIHLRRLMPWCECRSTNIIWCARSEWWCHLLIYLVSPWLAHKCRCSLFCDHAFESLLVWHLCLVLPSVPLLLLICPWCSTSLQRCRRDRHVCKPVSSNVDKSMYDEVLDFNKVNTISLCRFHVE